MEFPRRARVKRLGFLTRSCQSCRDGAFYPPAWRPKKGRPHSKTGPRNLDAGFWAVVWHFRPLLGNPSKTRHHAPPPDSRSLQRIPALRRLIPDTPPSPWNRLVLGRAVTWASPRCCGRTLDCRGPEGRTVHPRRLPCGRCRGCSSPARGWCEWVRRCVER